MVTLPALVDKLGFGELVFSCFLSLGALDAGVQEAEPGLLKASFRDGSLPPSLPSRDDVRILRKRNMKLRFRKTNASNCWERPKVMYFFIRKERSYYLSKTCERICALCWLKKD